MGVTARCLGMPFLVHVIERDSPICVVARSELAEKRLRFAAAVVGFDARRVSGLPIVEEEE
jgi:hypothetical protein